jgi:hypothetical protein
MCNVFRALSAVTPPVLFDELCNLHCAFQLPVARWIGGLCPYMSLTLFALLGRCITKTLYYGSMLFPDRRNRFQAIAA